MSEFTPLNVPRVASSRPTPAAPVNWFQVLAPRFVAEETAEDLEDSPEPFTSAAPSGAIKPDTQKALFSSIDAIAEKALRMRRQEAPESAEVIRIRSEAEDEARRLVAEAREQAHSLLEESRETGRQIGYEAGYAAGQQEAIRHLTQRADDERAVILQDLSSFIASMEETSRRAWIEMEPEILALVFEIAKKVIKMEVEINREAAIEVVRNALRRVADTTSLRIRVHADDLPTVRANRERLFTIVDNIRHVEIVEDRRVGVGGCIVETDAGTIDARIETQIEEVRKLLEQAVSTRDG